MIAGSARRSRAGKLGRGPARYRRRRNRQRFVAPLVGRFLLGRFGILGWDPGVSARSYETLARRAGCSRLGAIAWASSEWGPTAHFGTAGGLAGSSAHVRARHLCPRPQLLSRGFLMAAGYMASARCGVANCGVTPMRRQHFPDRRRLLPRVPESCRREPLRRPCSKCQRGIKFRCQRSRPLRPRGH
jgi:hypothetical protein